MPPRVLITGAGGFVATALAQHFDDVIALKHRALDITDHAMVRDVIDRARPDLVINTAVIGVDQCERDPALAERVNIDGPAFLAEEAARVDAEIVHFSSNYVYDGRPAIREPYTIDSEAHPINIYGKTKLIGERAVAELCPRSYIVRTSWVFGNDKESFLSTVAARLHRGETVKAISDTWASTTYVADLALRVLDLISLRRYGLHQIVNDGICSYETFARRAAQLAAIPKAIADRLINVVSEAQMERDAPRPPWTPMRSTLPMRPWEDALADYINAAPR